MNGYCFNVLFFIPNVISNWALQRHEVNLFLKITSSRIRFQNAGGKSNILLGVASSQTNCISHIWSFTTRHTCSKSGLRATSWIPRLDCTLGLQLKWNWAATSSTHLEAHWVQGEWSTNSSSASACVLIWLSM